MTKQALTTVLLAMVLGGCSESELTLENADSLGVLREPIYGGELDTTHGAVVAIARVEPDGSILDTQGACSGTIVAVRGSSAAILTAAHCAAEMDANGFVSTPVRALPPSSLAVLPGPDWLSSYDTRTQFEVTEIELQPSYAGEVVSTADLALLRIVGATEATPSIPTLTAAEDELAADSEVLVVGYGVTESDTWNTSRRLVSKQLDAVSDFELSYQQLDRTGSCSGDSGGPLLVATGLGERVAGVTSHGDAACARSGSAVRVSAHEEFVRGFNDAMPAELGCTECRIAASSPGNECAELAVSCSTINAPCGVFRACSANCTDAACRASCERDVPQGASDHDTLEACTVSACALTCRADAETARAGGCSVSAAPQPARSGYALLLPFILGAWQRRGARSRSRQQCERRRSTRRNGSA